MKTIEKNIMKAVVYKNFGAPERLQLTEIGKPSPGPEEVLIRVQATTVTSADCMMRRGDTLLSRILLGFTKPAKRYQILGTEFSGIVETTGIKVTKFKPGDEIYAFRGFGTGCYAEYKCMSEKGSIAIKPSNMSFEEAASVVDGASTALFFLRDKANIQAGQKVLINGASGSIGTFAVQLARHLGADVTGVCSTRNTELVSSLGAAKVVDYTKDDFTMADEKYDVIFDTIGKSSFRKCRRVLNPGGKYISTVMSPTILLQTIITKAANKKVIFSMSINKTEALNYLRTLIENDELRTIIDRRFTFDDLQKAHEYVEHGHKKGNVVISLATENKL